MAPKRVDPANADFTWRTLHTDFAEISEATQRTGMGYLKYSNGVIYDGEWLDGERHGLGVCFYPSGNIFVGQFQCGQMEGKGTMFFATGACFIGEFRGSAIYKGVYSSGGQEISGVWQDGIRVSSMPATSPEVLQRARAALFSTVVELVNEYLWASAPDSTQITIPQQTSGAAPLVPPSDIASSSAADAGSTRLLLQRQPTDQGSMEDGAASLGSVRFRAPSSTGDVDTKDGGRGVLQQYGAPVTIFACAAPCLNEIFALSRFCRRLFVFLFPFLSLPWLPVAPLRVTSLADERYFVVSGAALRQDFDVPSFSLAVVAIAMCCQIASIVLVACRVELGRVQDGALTLPDMVVPCVLWLVVALCGASYYGFCRLPHGLERVDRRLTPKLSAFAASLVDAKASVCIYTYDEHGKGKVMNRHYKYRWLFVSVVFGAMMSLSAPATRGGFGHNMFGKNGFQMAATLLAFFATFFFSATLSFMILKVTDMQREIYAKLHVLTNLAYLERRCLMNPSKDAHMAFDLDETFDPQNLFAGFPGWYSLRSLLLCTSMCANHNARRMTVGVFWFTMVSAFIVGIADTSYMVRNHYDRSRDYYSTAHAYAFFAFPVWGTLLLRYLFVSGATRQEMRRHLYIMDVTSLYQRMKLKDTDGSEVVQQCRRMAAANDAAPELFPHNLSTFVGVMTTMLAVAGTAAITFQLGEVIYY